VGQGGEGVGREGRLSLRAPEPTSKVECIETAA
jgi:hypothetical protein